MSFFRSSFARIFVYIPGALILLCAFSRHFEEWIYNRRIYVDELLSAGVPADGDSVLYVLNSIQYYILNWYVGILIWLVLVLTGMLMTVTRAAIN